MNVLASDCARRRRNWGLRDSPGCAVRTTFHRPRRSAKGSQLRRVELLHRWAKQRRTTAARAGNRRYRGTSDRRHSGRRPGSTVRLSWCSASSLLRLPTARDCQTGLFPRNPWRPISRTIGLAKSRPNRPFVPRWAHRQSGAHRRSTHWFRRRLRCSQAALGRPGLGPSDLFHPRESARTPLRGSNQPIPRERPDPRVGGVAAAILRTSGFR